MVQLVNDRILTDSGFDYTDTYWCGKGKHEALAEALHKLIPSQGQVVAPRKNRALEKFRQAQNVYYDIYNNGLCNMRGEFRKAFGFGSQMTGYGRRRDLTVETYKGVEAAMDRIILAAAAEQLTDFTTGNDAR